MAKIVSNLDIANTNYHVAKKKKKKMKKKGIWCFLLNKLVNYWTETLFFIVF